MNPTWEISGVVLERYRNLVDKYSRHEKVLERRDRNIKRKGIDLSKNFLWHVFVGCQVTTQQRSGPDTQVGRFMNSKSPALNYRSCIRAHSLIGMLEQEFSTAGLRRSPTMASNLATIHENLEGGEWNTLLQHLKTLERNTTQSKELKVAQYLSSKLYPGLGPKQSRNFIQWIGLSRFEVPIDSRVLTKLKEFGCTFAPKQSALSDESVYRFVQSGIQQIAASLDIYPCILDACIFYSFDE